jgi:hypothetical protein
MSGPGEPPEGTPEGASGGGEDEYRSVVFDESFVKAARIQEFSARERQDDATRPVRIRHVLPGGLARQAVALVLLVVVAFAFAIYMGVRHPYTSHEAADAERLSVTVIPLVPTGTVRAVSPAHPFAGTKADDFPSRGDGLKPKTVQGVGSWSEDDVRAGYDAVEQFLRASALDPDTVTGGEVRLVQDLLDPAQVELYRRSLSSPAPDGVHEVTGWLVRFDPNQGVRVKLATSDVKVKGGYTTGVTPDGRLEITADHTYVYAIRSAADARGPVSLFSVRRRLVFHFDRDQLQQQLVDVVHAEVSAGPLACAAEVQSYFRPILAGQSAPGAVAPADPLDHGKPPAAVCAPLSGLDPAGAEATPGPGTAPATPPATSPVTATGPGSPAARPQGRARSPLPTR